MDSTAAKEFLISKIIEEARIKHVVLSETEKKMLYFTEVQPSLPDIYEVHAEFERNYDSDEYEAKIAGLLRNARTRDQDESAAQAQEWKDALDALKKEDHYILVMVQQAFGAGSATGDEHRVRDFLIYVAVGVGIVLLVIFKTVWDTRH
jgi:hypothetical protein